MKILQVIGASYSGSTVLGYALNTSSGIFFGSETYRVLKTFREHKSKIQKIDFWPACDFCSRNCPYWSDSLFREIKRLDINTLDDVYCLFSKRYPEIDIYCDGSKHLKHFDNCQADFRIVTTKHPVRMLASHFYNERKKLGFLESNYDLFQLEIEKNLSRCLVLAEQYFLKTVRLYKNFFKIPDTFFFQVDIAHKNDFEIFRKIEDLVGVDKFSIKPDKFGSFPVHSLGGNRAPLWISQAKRGMPPLSNSRFIYYTKAESIGDWRLDNKYLCFFNSEFLNSLMQSNAYRQACDTLCYSTEVL